jgi:hypothetical protein
MLTGRVLSGGAALALSGLVGCYDVSHHNLRLTHDLATGHLAGKARIKAARWLLGRTRRALPASVVRRARPRSSVDRATAF